jgi:hypothetical protein
LHQRRYGVQNDSCGSAWHSCCVGSAAPERIAAAPLAPVASALLVLAYLLLDSLDAVLLRSHVAAEGCPEAVAGALMEVQADVVERVVQAPRELQRRDDDHTAASANFHLVAISCPRLLFYPASEWVILA